MRQDNLGVLRGAEMSESKRARYTLKFKTALVVILASVALLFLGVGIGRYELLPISRLAYMVKSIKKGITVFMAMSRSVLNEVLVAAPGLDVTRPCVRRTRYRNFCGV